MRGTGNSREGKRSHSKPDGTRRTNGSWVALWASAFNGTGGGVNRCARPRRTRIGRPVARVIEAEDLEREIWERLTDDEALDELSDRPVAEIVARIGADLGLEAVWDGLEDAFEDGGDDPALSAPTDEGCRRGRLSILACETPAGGGAYTPHPSASRPPSPARGEGDSAI